MTRKTIAVGTLFDVFCFATISDPLIRKGEVIEVFVQHRIKTHDGSRVLDCARRVKFFPATPRGAKNAEEFVWSNNAHVARTLPVTEVEC